MLLYYTPETSGFHDCTMPVQTDYVTTCMDFCTFQEHIPCDQTVYELAVLNMGENNLAMARDAFEALTLYHTLRTAIRQVL